MGGDIRVIQQYETMRREASKLANPHPQPHPHAHAHAHPRPRPHPRPHPRPRPHQASKLAKKHQKEVATLDDKFKERMHGLTLTLALTLTLTLTLTLPLTLPLTQARAQAQPALPLRMDPHGPRVC